MPKALPFKAHPWHGISSGEHAPQIVNAFIEIVPGDTVKYEVDKPSGFLRVDRPQQYSNIVPLLYGFVPQTYCGDEVARYAASKSDEEVTKGDGDPLDICVFCERNISQGGILLHAIPIGGFRMIDNGDADDKIIAVLENDNLYGHWKNIGDVPEAVLDRIRHYFLTYKNIPGKAGKKVIIDCIYDRDEAHLIIEKSRTDYRNYFSD